MDTLLLSVLSSEIVETTDDYVMLSALQHFVYCPRQFALIHLEQVWQENIYTLRGLRVHEQVDVPSHELIEGVRVERSLALISHSHQLRGIADVVEFLADGNPTQWNTNRAPAKPKMPMRCSFAPRPCV